MFTNTCFCLHWNLTPCSKHCIRPIPSGLENSLQISDGVCFRIPVNWLSFFDKSPLTSSPLFEFLNVIAFRLASCLPNNLYLYRSICASLAYSPCSQTNSGKAHSLAPAPRLRFCRFNLDQCLSEVVGGEVSELARRNLAVWSWRPGDRFPPGNTAVRGQAGIKFKVTWRNWRKLIRRVELSIEGNTYRLSYKTWLQKNQRL